MIDLITKTFNFVLDVQLASFEVSYHKVIN